VAREHGRHSCAPFKLPFISLHFTEQLYPEFLSGSTIKTTCALELASIPYHLGVPSGINFKPQ
jgi:hypothetical protein